MNSVKAPRIRTALARAMAYRLLARAFARPDADLAGGVLTQQLRRALRALGSSDDLMECLADLHSACRNADRLNEQFVRLFNPSVAANCPPYETEYTGAHVFMRAQQLADVAGFYRAFGLRVASAFHERPDHIAAELEFMQVLVLKEARALAPGERGNARVCRDAQANFLRDHLGRWLAPYAQRLATQAAGGFYGALVAFARTFVAQDARRLGVHPEIAAPLRVAGPEAALECPVAGGENDAAG